MPATLSLLGLYQINKNLFDDILLPAGVENERETIKNTLLLNSAELEVLYPDPDTMRAALGLYSHERIDSWNKLYDTTVLKYNPIWNKDGTVTETEKINSNGNKNSKGHENGNKNTRGSESGNSQSSGRTQQRSRNKNSNTNNHFVYGYNEASGAQDSRSEDSGSSSGSGKQTDSSTGSHSTNSTGSEDHSIDSTNTENHADNSDRTTTRTEQGNIGVTTTQSMILEERNVDEFSIVRYIVNDIIHAVCILVY